VAEIINLRQARKQRERAAKQAEAAANRAQHGRTKAEKTLATAREDKAQRDLAGHKRDNEPEA
jgi:hypothetical protein